MPGQPDHRAIDRLPLAWARMLQLVNAALSHATAVLIERGLVAVTYTSTFDDLLRALDDEIGTHATLIRTFEDRRVPAVDLCRIVTGAQVSIDAACLGGLARSLTDLARSRPAERSWPAEPDGILREMAGDCLTMIATVAAGLNSADTATPLPVETLQRSRDAVGVSHALLCRRLAALGENVDVCTSVDLCLAGQCLIRCVEHIFSTARHLALMRSATTGGHGP